MLRSRALAVAALALAGCAPELNWRDWRTDSPGVTLLFPCKPVRQQRTLAIGPTPRTVVLHMCDAGASSWAVAQMDVDAPDTRASVLKELVAAVHANLAAPSGAPVGAVPEGTDRLDGVGRYRVAGRTPGGEPRQAEHLLLAVGGRLIQVSALGVRLDAEAVETFLGSVRVSR